jgi:hypothetical protein
MTTTKKRELTVQDLLEQLERPDHLGYGYLSHGTVSDRNLDRIDRLVVAEANKRHWSPDDLFFWANSKHGRWFWDQVFPGTMSNRAILEQVSVWGCFDLSRIT